MLDKQNRRFRETKPLRQAKQFIMEPNMTVFNKSMKNPFYIYKLKTKYFMQVEIIFSVYKML